MWPMFVMYLPWVDCKDGVSVGLVFIFVFILNFCCIRDWDWEQNHVPK